MNIYFEEHSPHRNLAPYVHTYWSARFNLNATPGFTQSVVPNGYVELIIHLSDDHCMLGESATDTGSSPDYTLIGIHTNQYRVRFDKTVCVFGIRFYPEGISNIFGLPPATVASTYADMLDVPGRDISAFCHQLRECNDTATRIALADAHLNKLLARNINTFDYTAVAARIVRQHAGLITQKDLMREVPISPRQLQRGFKDRFGLTTKAYMRIARLNAVQRYMRAQATPDFATIAYENGYADQSHFIREFKAFTGAPPAEFIRSGSRFIINP